MPLSQKGMMMHPACCDNSLDPALGYPTFSPEWSTRFDIGIGEDQGSSRGMWGFCLFLPTARTNT